jgi:hypothetical protein
MNDHAALKVLNLKRRWIPSPVEVRDQRECGGRSLWVNVSVMVCLSEPEETLGFRLDDIVLRWVNADLLAELKRRNLDRVDEIREGSEGFLGMIRAMVAQLHKGSSSVVIVCFFGRRWTSVDVVRHLIDGTQNNARENEYVKTYLIFGLIGERS